MYSAVDHVVPAAPNAHAVRDGVGSADVTEIVLEDSYHVATLDNDAELIEKESLGFISRVADSARTQGAP
jgi:carboxylesterase